MHDIFSGLPESVQEEAASRMRQRKVCKGETLYSQGDTPAEMYQLITGGVKLCSYGLDGREFIAAEFRAGDCLGEMGLIDGMPRVSEAVATEDSLVRVLRKQDFDALMEAYPVFSRHVTLMLCRRLRWAYGLSVEASRLNLPQRMALQLYRLSQSHGARDKTGELYVAISQEELGTMLGASRQTVNKELKGMMEAGWVELRYGKIYLNDPENLCETYESLLGSEQVTAAYRNQA